jgi:hypothetical protein
MTSWPVSCTGQLESETTYGKEKISLILDQQN